MVSKVPLFLLFLCYASVCSQTIDYCKTMCQISGSSKNCELLLTNYVYSENLPLFNFHCCMSDLFFKDHINYSANLTVEFLKYVQSETDKYKLKDYAQCIGKCTDDKSKLSQEECDIHINLNFAACTRKYC